MNDRNTLTFSAFGDPSVGDMGPQRTSSATVEDPTSQYSEIHFGGNNAAVRLESELFENTFLQASVAYHMDKFKEQLQVNQASGQAFFDPVTGDSLATPISFGGPGFYDNAESQNTQYLLKLSNFFKGGGEHNLRYGAEFQDIGYDNTANYSGPSGLVIPIANDPSLGADSVTYATATSGFSWDLSSDTFHQSHPYRLSDRRDDESLSRFLRLGLVQPGEVDQYHGRAALRGREADRQRVVAQVGQELGAARAHHD